MHWNRHEAGRPLAMMPSWPASSTVRAVVGLVAAMLAGGWLGFAGEWIRTIDEPGNRQLAAIAWRSASCFAAAFAVCEIGRRLLRAGWLFVVPATSLAGSAIFATIDYTIVSGLPFEAARVVLFTLFSLPVMAGVVAIARVTFSAPAARRGRSAPPAFHPRP